MAVPVVAAWALTARLVASLAARAAVAGRWVATAALVGSVGQKAAPEPTAALAVKALVVVAAG